MSLTPADPVIRPGPRLESCTSTPPAHASACKWLTQGAPPPTNLLLGTLFCCCSAWGWCSLLRDAKGWVCTLYAHVSHPCQSCHQAWIPGMGPCWGAAHPLPLHTPPPTNGLLKSPLHLQTAYSTPRFATSRHGDGACRRGMGLHAVNTCLSPPATLSSGLDPRDGPVLGSCTSTPPVHTSAYKWLTQGTHPPTNLLLSIPFRHHSAWRWCPPLRDASGWAHTLCTHASHPCQPYHQVWIPGMGLCWEVVHL